MLNLFRWQTRHIIVLIGALTIATAAQSQWMIEKRRDEIRRTSYTMAQVMSPTAPPGARGARLSIIVQHDPTNPDPDDRHLGALVLTGALFDCPANDCHVSARIGDSEPEILSVDISKDMRRLYLYPNGIERIEQAAKARATLWLEVPVFRRGDLQYQFKLQPLPN